MSGYNAKILNNSLSAISASQAAIALTSNNIANVNTPGYARRTIQLETRTTQKSGAGFSIGNGVNVAGIKRTVDEFLNKLVRDAQGDKSSAAVQKEYLARLEPYFSLTGDRQTIGGALSDFFSAVGDLVNNPASIELRTVAIQKANDLVDSIKTTYNAIADLQADANKRISDDIDRVNSLTAQIAKLNSAISLREGSGQVAADERDQRDKLLEELATKISFNTTEVSDGSVTLTLSNGFALVSGSNSRSLEVTTNPSFASGSLPPSLGGTVMSYIVFDYDTSGSNPAHLDLTSTIRDGEGSLSGLLKIRGINDVSNTSAFSSDGTLVSIASRIEALTRSLLSDVNTTYLGPDEDTGTAGWQPSAGDLDGNTPSVYGLFTFTFSGTLDVNGDGLPNDIGNHTGIDNYSSLLSVTISDPRAFAAARDSDTNAGSTNFAPGDAQNAEALYNMRTANRSFATGSFSQTTTYEGLYNQTVAYVGNTANSLENTYSIAEDNLVAASNRRDELSGVSLDEEFANLIRFQRAFQASARLIRVSDELLNQIVGLF